MAQDYIVIKGAKTHNLKNIDLEIPHGKLIVITGVSGSGKSSLAFDTIFAEGRRRYAESISSYIRQYLGKMEKPPVEYIKGLAPAIAIEQKVSSTNARSTVGTVTEIYDYLKILYARIGKTFSPKTGREVKKHNVQDVLAGIASQDLGTKFYLLAPIFLPMSRSQKEQLELYLGQGFSRLRVGKEVLDLQTNLNTDFKAQTLYLLIDRLKVSENAEELSRMADSIQTAFYEGSGNLALEFLSENGESTWQYYNNRFEEDGEVFTEPSESFFSFNSPAGACTACEGLGYAVGIHPDLVIPNVEFSVYQDAVAVWKSDNFREWKASFLAQASKVDFPIHKAYKLLSKAEKDLLWHGDGKKVAGIYAFFDFLRSQTHKVHYRVLIHRYSGITHCHTCNGSRLRTETNYVKIVGVTLSELLTLPLTELHAFFEDLPKKISPHEQAIAKILLLEIQNRLQYLLDVGLGYLHLNRASNTLSGGESQRINLATGLGSSLVGSLYILDEPSIGLHPRDTQRLIGVLRSLQALGNTVIVVEHELDMMKSADYIIDIGPYAGRFGGEVVFAGTPKELLKAKKSLTADYILGKKAIAVPKIRRTWKNSLKITGARENNLKNIDVQIPLQVFTAITGVSGSGKSTLIKNILYPALQKALGNPLSQKMGKFDDLTGNLKSVSQVEFIDQNPIGRSSRSNPVTYVKAFDDIRAIFAAQPLSKKYGFTAGRFSFNVAGGRCDACEGEGQICVEMQFLADVHLPCEACGGKRFKEEILQVTYKGKNIADVLQLSIEEALTFFETEKNIVKKISPLQEVGLGYLQLGQSSSTLSGGEAQRIKLASYLIHSQNPEPILFIFDEPTTGLHFYDIEKLLIAFNRLLDLGHSLVVIEHNIDLIKNADYVIDLGAEGGDKGGHLVFAGTPEELAKCKDSYTGRFLIF